MSNRTKTLSNAQSEKATTPIRSIQQMWDATIEYRKDGLFDSDAMRLVYRRMDPRLTYQNIADVFSGVYASAYWKTTFMDPQALAESMRKGTGLSYNLALGYAKTSMRLWRGILCRKNFGDVGLIPTQGSYTRSPDIVCNQNTPLDPDLLIRDWNSSFWRTPQVGKNFCYVRCQNSQFSGGIEPEVQMFFTKAGFNQPPTSWNTINTERGTRVGKVYLQNGTQDPMEQGIRGASEAFIYEASEGGHVCLIAAVKDLFFDNNDPTLITDNWSSARWITHNGAAAWHNLDVQSAAETSFVFHNQDGSAQKFVFEAVCSNLPEGSTVELSTSDASLGVKTGPIEITKGTQIIRSEVLVPAYHEDDLIVTLLDPDGNLLPESASVEIKYNWVLHQGHRNYADAVGFFQAFDQARNAQDFEVNMGTYTLIGAK